MPRLNKILKKFDVYARPVQLTYNHRNKFASGVGGFFSLVSLGLLLSWLVIQFQTAFGPNFVETQDVDLIGPVGKQKPVFDIEL